MTTPQAGNPASAFAATVGRYFTVVSVVPSLLLVAFVVVLARSGAWSSEPDLGKGIQALAQLGLAGTFALILAALALGAVLHPLQFALVQFLEGYWGVSTFWNSLRESRIRFHVHRRAALREQIVRAGQAIEDYDDAVEQLRVSGLAGGSPAAPAGFLADWELANRHSESTAAERLRSIYPVDVRDVMPTRLGNVLRAAERSIGAATGLSIIDFASHLMMVAPREQADYVNDQRTSLDLAIRTCLVCILAFLITVMFLWPHNLWLLVSLVPLGLAWLCYQGAVTAAREYGSALRMVLDLNRFTLYERMRLPLPKTTAGERKLVEQLKALSADPDNEALIRYRHPPKPPTCGTSPCDA